MINLESIVDNRTLLSVKWNSVENAKEYSIEGVTSIFEFIPIINTDKTEYIITKDNNFVGYRVTANIIDKDKKSYVLDRSNIIIFKKENNYENIEIYKLKAPNNKISYSLRSEKLYDFYRLYDENDNFIADTDDFIYISSNNENVYKVEAYEKTDKGYDLKAISNCPPKDVVLDSKKKKDLSVIIPVYNSCDFLIRCVQCILSSTYNNLIIILVDDCSEEYTANICNQYASMFKDNIKLIRHDTNKSICTSRNDGLNIVDTEYTAFCDHDDMVHPYLYGKLMDKLHTGKFDVAIGQCRIKNNFEDISNLFACNPDETIEYHSFKEMTEAKGSYKNIYFIAIWNRIVKTDISKKVKFIDEMPWYEDTTYSHAIYSYSNDFVLVGNAYYIWDKRKQITVGTATNSLYNGMENEKIWRYHAVSNIGVLLYGNKDPEIANIYKKEVVKDLINMYHDRLKNTQCPAQKIYAGIMLYYYYNYQLPFDILDNDNDREKHHTWLQILTSDIQPWDGFGDIPKVYYE